MISFKAYLTEARMAPLYHGTYGDAIYSILVRNKGIEPRTGHSPRSLLKKAKKEKVPPTDYVPGISLTRSFKFAVSYGSGYVLEIDQEALAQRFHIKPINFFQHHEPKARYPGKIGGIGRHNEFEEYVITDKPIPTKYILRMYYPKVWDSYFKAGNWLIEKEFIDGVRDKYGSQFIRTY